MKFKDYFHSLVSKRKSLPSTNKSQTKLNPTTKQQENSASVDGHYDVCGYEDVNNLLPDDHHSRTQILLARHAELVNNIVGTRSSNENFSSNSCSQCRLSQFQPGGIPPPLPPPPLPPKLSYEQHTSFANRNYSSTLATCSPRRECQQIHPTHLISSQYSTPNPSVISSSSSSLWTTSNTQSKKQRSRIRTNPWIGKTLNHPHRPSTFIETSCVYHHHHHHHPCTPSSTLPISSQPEYCVYDPTFRASPPGLIHSESFPQTTSNGNIQLITLPSPPPTRPPPAVLVGPMPTSNIVLHQSDSGHGFSLSSSRVIDSSSSSSTSSSSPPSNSSSPDSTSAHETSCNGKSNYRQKKLKKTNPSMSPSSLMNTSTPCSSHTKSHSRPNTIASDGNPGVQRTNSYRTSPPITLQYHYQRSTMTSKSSPMRMSNERQRHHHPTHSTSSSSRSIDDHFSLEFEEILENERSYKQRKDRPSTAKSVSPPPHSPRKSPFILPLDDTNIKLSSPPPVTPSSTLFSSTLAKTNSRAILRHIEEIENEIRMIKNLDLARDDDENDDFLLSPHAYPEDDLDLDDRHDSNQSGDEPLKINVIRPSIYDQVDQWVEKCLQTTSKTNNPAARLHDECDHLSNTIKDYIGYVCVNDEQQQEQEEEQQQQQTPTAPQQTNQLMISANAHSDFNRLTKRTSSFIDRSLKLAGSETVTSTFKSVNECPF